MTKRCSLIAVKTFIIFFAISGAGYIDVLLAEPGTLPTLTFNSAAETPLSNADNSGFLDRLLSVAMERVGYTLKRVQLPAERALRDVDKGILDGEFIRIDGIQAKYPNLLKVDEKIIDIDFVVFSEQPIDTSQGWQVLAPLNVTFISGWKIIEANVPKQSRVTMVNSPDQLFHMLFKKRADAVIYERWAGLNIITSDPNFSNIKIRLPPLATNKMYCYLNSKHAALVPQLADVLKDLKKDGTYDKLFTASLHRLSE